MESGLNSNRNSMKSQLILLTTLGLVCSSCLKNKINGDSDPISDGFETISTIEDITAQNSPWNYTQITEDANYIEIDTTNEFSGDQCLKFYAVKSDNGASKCDIANNKKLYRQDDVVMFSGMFYIEGTEDLNDIFFFDIEETVAVGAGPGLRFELQGADGHIIVERKKMLEENIEQPGTPVSFPRNQWVKVDIEMLLTRKKKGWIKVYQDGVQVIDASKIRTLPKDKSTLIQGTKGVYNNIQVGITANSPVNDAVMYLDDVSISVK